MSAPGRSQFECGRAQHDDGRITVVLGAGWAGCAAAVELARCGRRVELHEAAGTLGGRARSVTRDGLPLDNGEHLLLGAYSDTQALAAQIRDGAERSAWTSEQLTIRPFAKAQSNALWLAVRDLPGALGLPVALLAATGLAWSERAAALAWFARQRMRGYKCDAQATVASIVADLPARVRDNLLAPICVAALNTPPHRASGQLFLNVLRETFGAGRRATTVIAPRDGLAVAIPERAGKWLVERGHAVRTSTRTRVIGVDIDAVVLDASGSTIRADAAVVAVGPHQLAATFAPDISQRERGIATTLAAVERFNYEPITTAYLGYAAPVSLPAGLLRLDDAPGQWLFDRADILRRAAPCAERPDIRSLLSVVISASGAHEALDHRALVAAIDAQLRSLAGQLPPLCWSQVIEERRATYACVPALSRPSCGRVATRVYLAGDYTYPTLPATLEAAVRSGLAAARSLTRDLPA